MTATDESAGPPRWAEAWLRSLLPPRDRETVTGDLLEEYRENIRPRYSAMASDLWYQLAIGFVTAWRTRSASAGGFGTLTSLTFVAVLSAIANALMLTFWHEPQTLAAIERSGGLVEVFALPFLIIGPGTLDGWIGATLAEWAVSHRSKNENTATD